MKVNELLSELRRNPTVNIKKGFHEEAVKFLKSKGIDMRNYGVSMTDIHKLGVNPNSRYNTPVGIYFYPAEYYMRFKDSVNPKKLPFQDDAPHIQIFEMNGNVIEISGMDVKEYNSYISSLYNNIGRISQLLGLSENNTHKIMANAIMSAPSEATKSDLYGGRLWYVLYTLSTSSGTNKRNTAAPRSSVIWNSILRLLDIDIMIDEGSGVIHQNEPYQGVVLNPRAIKLVHTITNHKELLTRKMINKEEEAEDEKLKNEINAAKFFNTLTSGSYLFFIKFKYDNGTEKSGKFFGKNDDDAINHAKGLFGETDITSVIAKPLN